MNDAVCRQDVGLDNLGTAGSDKNGSVFNADRERSAIDGRCILRGLEVERHDAGGNGVIRQDGGELLRGQVCGDIGDLGKGLVGRRKYGQCLERVNGSEQSGCVEGTGERGQAGNDRGGSGRVGRVQD